MHSRDTATRVCNFGTRDGRTAEFLDGLQNGAHRGKGDSADQSTHGRMMLGTACKAETSRMKCVSLESSGRKRLTTMGSGKLCIHRKIL
jgi:hypothetical protein